MVCLINFTISFVLPSVKNFLDLHHFTQLSTFGLKDSTQASNSSTFSSVIVKYFIFEKSLTFSCPIQNIKIEISSKYPDISS